MVIDFIENKNIPQNILRNICLLKQQHWDYSIKDQIQWINNNLTGEDVHLILRNNSFVGNEIIGYLNLVNLFIEIDNEIIKMIGVGNVCVDKKYLGNKYGYFLIKTVEYFLQKNKLNGVLLCKDNIIPFYESVRWYQYKGITKIKEILFNDKVYFYNEIISKEIIISKYF